jgi:predicted DCC family thiol-disulfide oxidoreductase YuxK
MAAEKPVLVFDGDCGFCRLWIERWRAATRGAIDYEPYQSAASRFPQVRAEDFARAVHLIEPDGRVRRGADAVFSSLARAGGVHRLWAGLYASVPLFRALSDRGYALVAARRPRFSRLTRLLWGGSALPPPIDGTRRAVLAGIGLCYLCAFWSFGAQARGLIGADGLLPAAGLLDAARAQLGAIRYWFFPTFAWFGASNAALVGFCAAGGAASLGLIFDIWAGPCALACWALYLSVCAVGADFMNFQWDALLLEAGLIGVFLAPWSARARGGTRPSRGALLLLRLLLFKLMLESALVKWNSGDPAWRDLTALTYHWWTQPLPTPAAWYAALLPLSFQKAACAVMFAIELGAPWLLLLPRRPRALGAGLIATLIALIALTGNYGFFDLLALVLCASALDDGFAFLARLAPAPAAREPSRWRGRALTAFAALWCSVGAITLAGTCGLRPSRDGAAAALVAVLEPFRSINSYGLFAVMTKTRDEISVEVSVDGRDWREWPFKFKPGDPRRSLPLVAPDMPRLDWQMWFAALGAPSPWFGSLLAHLLHGSPDVEALLGPNPLGDAKPVYARGVLWSTRFSTPAERRADGSLWHRERGLFYFPAVSLPRPADASGTSDVFR